MKKWDEKRNNWNLIYNRRHTCTLFVCKNLYPSRSAVPCPPNINTTREIPQLNQYLLCPIQQDPHTEKITSSSKMVSTRLRIPICAPPCLSMCVFFSLHFPPLQTVVWLPVFGIFNVRSDVDACDCTRGLYGHRKRVCTGSWLWEKNH